MDESEILRRRRISLDNYEQMKRERFDEWYQQECDSTYWSSGQCCAGCDHWVSAGGFTGECRVNGMIPGDQVMKSMGIRGCTHDFGPGFPFTKIDDWCGKFKDDFDWRRLSIKYLEEIGAMDEGKMKEKPKSVVVEIRGN